MATATNMRNGYIFSPRIFDAEQWWSFQKVSVQLNELNPKVKIGQMPSGSQAKSSGCSGALNFNANIRPFPSSDVVNPNFTLGAHK
jgi:hypothetical protein